MAAKKKAKNENRKYQPAAAIIENESAHSKAKSWQQRNQAA